jgi:NADPH:quinone reductase-like Zn-dependent oxidoreductase
VGEFRAIREGPALIADAFAESFSHVAIEGERNEADLATIAAMIEAGDVTAVIDRVYPLDKAPDALRYVEDGHPKGKVVVTVGDERPEAHEPGGAV